MAITAKCIRQNSMQKHLYVFDSPRHSPDSPRLSARSCTTTRLRHNISTKKKGQRRIAHVLKVSCTTRKSARGIRTKDVSHVLSNQKLIVQSHFPLFEHWNRPKSLAHVPKQLKRRQGHAFPRSDPIFETSLVFC